MSDLDLTLESVKSNLRRRIFISKLEQPNSPIIISPQLEMEIERDIKKYGSRISSFKKTFRGRELLKVLDKVWEQYKNQLFKSIDS
jgi:hypothetical protein